MKKHLYSRSLTDQSTAGFTFLELLVVILIVGILGAIAAPSWLGFMSRQRLGRVQDEIVQILSEAQSGAKQRKLPRTVTFATDGSLDVVIAGAINETLGSGAIEDGVLTLGTTPDETITFNPDGSVDPADVSSVISLSIPNSPATRCVIVDSLLGAVRKADENDAACP